MHVEYRRVPIAEIQPPAEGEQPTPTYEAISRGSCVVVAQGSTYAYLRCIAGATDSGELLADSLDSLPANYRTFFLWKRIKRTVDVDGEPVEVEMLVRDVDVQPADVILSEAEPVRFAGE